MLVSRRQLLRNAALTTTAAAFAPRSLFAQAAPTGDRLTQMRAAGATAKITTQSLRGNVSVLMGSGGNIAVLPGKDGKLLVDSGFATSRPQLTEALASISADPLKTLIDTHWHFDHTDGNEWIHGAGATIVAHENTRQRLSTPQHMPVFGVTVPASPAGALPTELFSSAKTLHANGATVAMNHYDPAHTDTDISVYFTEADVYHTGDTWFNGLYPFIDYSTGGNIDGMIKAVNTTLSRTTAKTIIIPGHGPVGDKAQLQQFHDMLVAVREKVAALKKQGRTADEVAAAKPTAEYDSSFKSVFGGPEFFVGLVYQGV